MKPEAASQFCVIRVNPNLGFRSKKKTHLRRRKRSKRPPFPQFATACTVAVKMVGTKVSGTKRKEAPAAKSNGKSSPKKAKLATSKPVKAAKSKPANLDLEAETDSDPIVESDTTEHSGEDDGVSWPSDNEADGGVALHTAKLQVSDSKPASAKENANGKFSRSFLHDPS